jgi:hypothetical protein
VRRLTVLAACLCVLGCEGTLSLPDPGDAPALDAGWIDAYPVDALDADAHAVDAHAVDARTGRPTADAGRAPGCTPPPAEPLRVLFVGNSFTFTAGMPATFRALAEAAGFPRPLVRTRAVGGRSLEWHRADTSPEGAPARIREGWDVVVLQELSTRPTDTLGDPAQFKDDATWLHDLAIGREPSATVVLYETFARAAGHPYYPRTFESPAEMQAQLRFHYDDCAERSIPEHTTVVVDRPVVVARVGDAWERVLDGAEPPRLHAEDDYHPNAQGAYLTALVFFGTIYGRSAEGLPSLGVAPELARALQEEADRTTGATEPAPSIACPRALPVGDVLPIDFGPTPVAGWASVDEIRGSVGPLTSAGGVATDARVSVRGFTGTQTGGSAINELGLPAGVSADSLWVGSFDGHEDALALRAEIEVSGLAAGLYQVELFASRDGDDAGNGRLTRYAIDARTHDLEVSDNRARAARFEDVAPDADGTVRIGVAVSPAGRARFAYAGSLRVTRMR